MNYLLKLICNSKIRIITFAALFTTVFYVSVLQAQTAVIRGAVTDKETGEQLPLVSVVVKNSTPVKGTVTDTSGNFLLNGMRPGRYDLVFSCIGYKSYEARELLLFTGKDVNITVKLEPVGYKTAEVTIKGRAGGAAAENSMALLGARSISIEQAARFAGGYDDPARLVTAFAGIGGGLQSNGISVRGNAPGYLQWKLEGTEIPNPNHFADLSVFGGGGLTALSANLIKSSDFLTGAFPAEYGNALSGVFDLQMRPGNTAKYEHSFQAGLTGVELASEGPLNNSGASYVASYRYSALGLLAPVLPEDAGGTQYQDASFKIQYPTGKRTVISLWGIGLADNSGQSIEKDSVKREFLQDFRKQDATQKTMATGLNFFVAGKESYLRAALSFSLNETRVTTEQLYPGKGIFPLNRLFYGWKSSDASVVYNSVLMPSLILRTGIAASSKFTQPQMDADTNGTGKLVTLSAANNNALLSSGFISLAFKPAEFTDIVAGMYVQHFSLNKKMSFEPRLSASVLTDAGKFSAAFGVHSRIERLQYYFVKDAAGNYVNKQLDFTKALHYTAGWSFALSGEVQVSVEAYHQQLYSVPVTAGGAFSVINCNDWFLSETLLNKGTGKNTGIELTVEKSLSEGWFGIAALSVFASKYAGADGRERDTRYNRNFILNVTAGKEWEIGSGIPDVFMMSVRSVWQGGERYSGVNKVLSMQRQDIVEDGANPFAYQYPQAVYIHLSASYRINTGTSSHEIALKVLNVTGRKEEQGPDLNPNTGEIRIKKELLVIPNLSYKYWF